MTRLHSSSLDSATLKWSSTLACACLTITSVMQKYDHEYIYCRSIIVGCKSKLKTFWKWGNFVRWSAKTFCISQAFGSARKIKVHKRTCLNQVINSLKPLWNLTAWLLLTGCVAENPHIIQASLVYQLFSFFPLTLINISVTPVHIKLTFNGHIGDLWGF